MYAAVELLYREGVKVTPQWPPLVGQLWTEKIKEVPVARVWPLDWVENTNTSGRKPLASLWHPVLVRIGPDDLLLRGYECIEREGIRRWVTQKWLARVLTAEGARSRYLRAKPAAS